MKKATEGITLEQATEFLKAKEEEKQIRFQEFLRLYNEIVEKTQCQVVVDTTSPLNDIRLIVASKT